ncbi:hypothetical protein [Roseixanthobacter pseudopolyaromaticivorans]|uniref:hypothetical protein n=1 Tax=Xanthobacteraceae TaxID=335928 RepID=UPI00372AB81C
MKTKVSISGLREVSAGLEQLKKSTQRAVLARVLKRAAWPVADAAKSMAPGGQGDLSKVGASAKAAADLQKAYDHLVLSAEQRITQMGTEAQVAGLSAAAAEELRFKTDLLNAAQAAGLKLTPQQLSQLDALAVRAGAAADALEKVGLQQQHLNELQQELGSLGVDAMSGLIDGTKGFNDVLQDGLKLLEQIVLKAAIMGEGPLGGLFGSPATSTGAGGLIGSLFSAFKGFDDGGFTGRAVFTIREIAR